MKNSPTAPGQTNAHVKNHVHESENARESKKAEMINVINQVFALFRRNYHNQYFKAFGDVEELKHVKQLWLEMLMRFKPESILIAAKKVVEKNDFLPTLHTMINYCEQADHDNYLPDAHSAYIEACRAPSPKSRYQWSHPAVYHAGSASDWFFLQSSAEHIAFPIFQKKYNDICDRVRAGEKLSSPAVTAIEEKAPSALNSKENQERMTALRNNLDL